MFNGNPNSFYFAGNVKIKIECGTPTNKIIMHGNMLNISNVNFGESGRSKGALPAPAYDPTRQFLSFRLNEFLEAGRIYEIDMDFRGPLKNDMKGLYLSTYNYEGQTRFVGGSCNCAYGSSPVTQINCSIYSSLMCLSLGIGVKKGPQYPLFVL